MCKVVINPDLEGKLNYYLFNIIVSKKPNNFTVKELMQFSEQYKLSINEEQTREIIGSWISKGIVRSNYWNYSII